MNSIQAGLLDSLSPSRRKRRVDLKPLAFGLPVIAFVCLTTWLQRPSASAASFQTARVTQQKLTAAVSAQGTLAARNTVEVGAEVSGRLTELLVDENDRVSAGQLLAEIKADDLSAAVDQSAAQVSAAASAITLAEATLKESKITLQRARSLRAEALISEQELDSAEADSVRAQAAVQSARANHRLALAGQKMARSRESKTRIRSPIDGIVIARLAEPGQTLTAGFETPVVYRIAADLTQMRLKVGIDEADIGLVKEGQRAWFTVEAYPGKRFPSRVLRVSNHADTSHRVVKYDTTLEVDNQEGLLRPHMTCAATIVTDERESTLVVPNAALRYAERDVAERDDRAEGATGTEQSSIFVMRGNSPHLVQLRVGLSDGAHTEVLDAPLQAGDLVVIDEEAEE